MSSCFWGMAVRAPQADVLEALRRWPNEEEARLEPWPSDGTDEREWLVFGMASHDGWSVLSFRFARGLVPALALHLARALGTRVISVDQDEAVGYQHFSVVDAGKVVQCFTLDVGDVVENIGVDLRALYEAGKGSRRVRLPSTYDESAMSLEAFNVFTTVVSDLDVEDLAADIEDPTYRIWAGKYGERAMATLTKAGRGRGPWWKGLV